MDINESDFDILVFLKEMDMSTGEYSKMDFWINSLIKIFFGYTSISHSRIMRLELF